MVDALMDPLHRRYRPFGEWAQDELPTANLWGQDQPRTSNLWAPQPATAGPSADPTVGPAKAWAELSTPKTLAPSGPTPQSPNAAGLTAPAPGATSTKLAQVTPAARGATYDTAAPAASGGYSTAGRTGATYDAFLAANPQFDPWTNLDQYAGAGAGNDPILAQAFGWTNQWARDNGYGDGKNIPLAQRQRVFMANLERARQQWTDNTGNREAQQGVTWDTSKASRLPNQGWAYEAGWGLAHPGQAYQGPGAAAPAAQTPPGTASAASAAGAAAVTQPTTPAPAAATPGQQTGGAPVADPTAGSDLALQGQYWMEHPNEAADAFLRSHNINPDQHTFMGDWLLKQVQDIAPDLFATSFGSGGMMPLDQLKDPNQLLNSIFYGGQGIGSNLRNYAQTGMNKLLGSPTMQGMGDPLLQDFLSRLQAFNTFGENPYLQQGSTNAFNARMNAQRIQQRNQVFNGQTPTSLWDFINQPGQPDYGSYGLPTRPGAAALPPGRGGSPTRY